jgi:L-lactate dehydrogenase complex protein LldG
MSGRDLMLERIRNSLQDVPSQEEPPEIPITRLAPPAEPEVVRLFVERVEEYRGTVRRTDDSSISSISSIVLELFGDEPERKLLVAPGVPDNWVPEGLRAAADTGFSPAELDAFDGVLTGCHLAIAETGTIVLDGPARSSWTEGPYPDGARSRSFRTCTSAS